MGAERRASALAKCGAQLARELAEEVASPSTSALLAELFPDVAFFGVQLHVGRVFVSVHNFVRPGRCRLALLHGRTTLAGHSLDTRAAVACTTSCHRAQHRWHDVKLVAEHAPDVETLVVVPVVDTSDRSQAGQDHQFAPGAQSDAPGRALATITLGLKAADAADSDRLLRDAFDLAQSLAPFLRDHAQRVLDAFAASFGPRSAIPARPVAPAHAEALLAPSAPANTAGGRPVAPAEEGRRSLAPAPAATPPDVCSPSRTGCAASDGLASSSSARAVDDPVKPCKSQPATFDMPRHSAWLHFYDRSSEQQYVFWHSGCLQKVQACLDLLLLVLLCVISGSPLRMLTSAAQPVSMLCIASVLISYATRSSPTWYARHRESLMQVLLLVQIGVFWNVLQPSLLASVGSAPAAQEMAVVLGTGSHLMSALVAKVRLTRYVPVLLLHLCAAVMRGVPTLCSGQCLARLPACRLTAALVLLASAAVSLGMVYCMEYVSRSLFVQQYALEQSHARLPDNPSGPVAPPLDHGDQECAPKQPGSHTRGVIIRGR